MTPTPRQGPGPGEPPDHALVAAASAGDRPAFDALCARYSPGLRRHFERTLAATVHAHAAPQIADELTQETWIECWRLLTAGRYDPTRARLSTFLYAIASNIRLRDLRRRGKAAAQSGSPTSEPAELADPADAAGLAASLELVRDVVLGASGRSEFTDDDRRVMRAIALGRSDRALADEARISPSTAHARKRSVLERLRAFLAPQGTAE
jgi:RNA polymerase sigma factor (sigma-70 family)